MVNRSEEVVGQPDPAQPVGRVRLPPDQAPPSGSGPQEKSSMLTKIALGVLMVGLTLIGILVILSGTFVPVPATIGGLW
jgi:hypothetical protein